MKLLPVLEKAFRLRKRPVDEGWRMDETYTRAKGDGGIVTGPPTRTATSFIADRVIATEPLIADINFPLERIAIWR